MAIGRRPRAGPLAVGEKIPGFLGRTGIGLNRIVKRFIADSGVSVSPLFIRAPRGFGHWCPLVTTIPGLIVARLIATS